MKATTLSLLSCIFVMFFSPWAETEDRMAAKHAHYGSSWPLKLSDSNKDLYGEREILKNYIELKRNFIPASIGRMRPLSAIF